MGKRLIRRMEERKKKLFVRYLLLPSTEQISIFNRLFQEHYQNVKIFHFYLYVETHTQKEETVEIKIARFRTIAIQQHRRWLKNLNTLKNVYHCHLLFYLYICKCNSKFSRGNLSFVVTHSTYRLNWNKKEQHVQATSYRNSSTRSHRSTMQQNKRQKRKENKIEQEKKKKRVKYRNGYVWYISD